MKQLNCTLRTPFSAVIIFSGYLVWIKVKTINIKKFLFVIHFSQRPLKIQFVCGLQLVLEVNLIGCLNRLHVLDQLNKVHFIRGGGDFSLQKLSLSTFLLNLRLDFFFFCILKLQVLFSFYERLLLLFFELSWMLFHRLKYCKGYQTA